MISTDRKQNQSQLTIIRPIPLHATYEPYPNQQRELPPNLPPSEDRRKNDKNKFINKLKQLHGEANSEIKTLHRSMPSNSAEGGDRKERNKLAARESRNRKKLYVKLMQAKIQNLEMEMIETVDEIQQLRLEIFNAQMHQGVQGKEAKHKQLHIIKKLEGLLASQEHQERNNEINICLDSIIYRIGALGNERKAALKKLYFDLLNFSQPALYRYILWSAVKKIGIFGDPFSEEEDKEWKQIESVASSVLQTPGLKEKIDAIGRQIAGHCIHFQKSAEDLVNFRAEIEKKGQLLDNSFNNIREALTPEQVANLILFVERYQFKREVRLFQDDQMGIASKRVKHELNSL